MKNRRDIMIAVLVIFCLTATLFTILPVSSSDPLYNPWLDINDDGKIDVKDVARVAKAFGSVGQSIDKASIQYDSGWIDITDKQGQNITVTHGLNSSDVMVDITGKTTMNGGQHQRQLGTADYYYVAGWNKTHGGTNDDEVRALVQTSDGGYALAGFTGSYGAGYRDFWLVRTEGEVGSPYGFSWIDSTTNSIILYRGSTDPYWNYVRIRIWQPKQTP